MKHYKLIVKKVQLYLESSIANPIVRVMAASYVARKVSNDDPSISNRTKSLKKY